LPTAEENGTIHGAKGEEVVRQGEKKRAQGLSRLIGRRKSAAPSQEGKRGPETS